MSYWIWFTAISSILFLYLLFQQFVIPKITKKRDLRRPPGPRELPIIGHFHLLGKNPHQDLHCLAQKHGPIMYMKFGSVPTVIASSPTAAKLFLKTHDHVFANRPHNETIFHFYYEQGNIAFGKYDKYWRDMRKLLTLELLSHRKVAQFQSMRKSELESLMTSLKQAADLREPVDLSDRVGALSEDMICLMLLGRKFTDIDQVFGTSKGLKDVIKDVLHEVGAFNIGDYFPYLRRLDLHGTARRMRNLRKALDEILDKIIDEHVQNKKNINTNKAGFPDFLGTMMDIANSGDAGFEFDLE